MGAFLAKMVGKLFTFKKQKRIAMLGLDAAGKTTILYQLKLAELLRTIPTIGFNVESIEYKSIEMTIWDVGGQDKIRPLWKHYLRGMDALIFVVDASDKDRMEVAQEELHYLMSQDELKDSLLLVYGNKMDLKGAATPSELTKSLQLSSLYKRKWYVQPSIAANGEGLYEGLDWLCETLRKQDK